MIMLAIVGVAIAVVLIVAVLGWRVARRRISLDDPEAAMNDAAGQLAGFAPVAAVVSADGAGALTADAAGRLALLRAGRRRASVREIGWTAVRATASGIEVHAPRARPFLLTRVDALDMRRLAPERRGAV